MIGLSKRISYAFRCFLSIVSSGEVPEDIASEVVKIPERVPPTLEQPQLHEVPAEPIVARALEDSTDRAVQVLALLQREGRLIDFFGEDISTYKDAQIGAAVRELHANCRKALDQYVKLEPVIDGEEDSSVTVEAGIEPAAIKLIGNVTGQLPLRGILRHRGWRVTEVKLPPLSTQEAGRSIVAPAEVEVN